MASTPEVRALPVFPPTSEGVSLYWVGVFDPMLRVFDIIMHTPYGTTYNSYLLKCPTANVLFETVKEPFFDEFWKRLCTVFNPETEKIDYIILNHTEPDHSGALSLLLQKYPKATVVATQTAIRNLEQIAHPAFTPEIARKPITPSPTPLSLSLGPVSIDFHVAPLLHWPDTMFSHVHGANGSEVPPVLVTCDFFGAHYCNTAVFNDTIAASSPGGEQVASMLDAYKYYFDCIFGPFKPYVLKGLAIAKTLKFEAICCSHGPVLRNDIPYYLDLYNKWAQPPVLENKVVIAYVSAYKYTRMMASAIAEGLTSVGVTPALFDMVETKLDEVVGALDSSKGLLLGTPTIVGEALPPIWDIASRLNPIIHSHLHLGVFGSYGWSGEGGRNMQSRIDQLGSRCSVPLEALTVRFKPTPEQLQQCTDWGKKFGRAVNGEKINERKKPAPVSSSSLSKFAKSPAAAIPNDGKMRKWKCIVCGEIVISILPPSICRACGAGVEAFVCIGLAGEATSQSTFSGKVVIIGSGAAATSAAKAIREINKTAEIVMISQEGAKPYYRPSLSKLMAKPELIHAPEFYLLPEDWYDTNNVQTIFNTIVTQINPAAKTITANEKEMHYDSLIIATGGECFVPFSEDMQYPHKRNVFSVRCLNDCLRIQEFVKAESPKSCIVIGGGLAALEGASSLKEMGLTNIHMVELMPRILPRQLSELASKLYQEILTKSGLALHFGCSAQSVLLSEDKKRATGICLSTGESLSADLILFAIGTRANTQLAKNCGAKVNRAIVVNEKMETTIPGVFACGDCTEYSGMNIPNWTEAIAQGRIAGLQSIGFNEETFQRQPSPYLLTAFESVFSVGDVSDPLNTVTMQRGPRELVQLFFKNGNLIGAIVLGAAAVKALQAPLNSAVSSGTMPLADAVTAFSML